jgi:hypothetical protein
MRRQDASPDMEYLALQPMPHLNTLMFLRKKNLKANPYAFTWKTTTTPWFSISTTPLLLFQVWDFAEIC